VVRVRQRALQKRRKRAPSSRIDLHMLHRASDIEPFMELSGREHAFQPPEGPQILNTNLSHEQRARSGAAAGG
jgi:hypothetical protein